MDINLPGMNGVEAVRRLKPVLPATQFVMLTVYEDADHIYNALSAGATGYLLKQTPREELLSALGDVHRGGSPMTSNIARKVVQSFKQTSAPVPPGHELSPRQQEVLELLPSGSTSACPPSIPTSGACTRSCTSVRAPRQWPSMPTFPTATKDHQPPPKSGNLVNPLCHLF